MTYQYVDDQMHCHRKIVKAGNEATGAWLRIGNWCAAHLTDGEVEHEVALMFARKEAILDKLVSVGLLERNGSDFRIHDYLAWNPTAKEVELRKEETHKVKVKAGNASACKRWGAGNRTGNRTGNKPVTNGQHNCNPPTTYHLPPTNKDHDHENTMSTRTETQVGDKPPCDAHRSAALAELVKADSPTNLARAEEDAREDLTIVVEPEVVSRKASSVGLVWNHWLTYKPETRRKSLDSKCPEYKIITKALSSYSADDLCTAIDGMFLDSWAVANKCELGWALRQDTKHNNIEKFIELSSRPVTGFSRIAPVTKAEAAMQSALRGVEAYNAAIRAAAK